MRRCSQFKFENFWESIPPRSDHFWFCFDSYQVSFISVTSFDLNVTLLSTLHENYNLKRTPKVSMMFKIDMSTV
jgi:hypothetical protein